MSYKINVCVYQTDTSTCFTLVEKTVWCYANGGTWTECNGEHVLTMGGSGTSGTLRFVNDKGEIFIVVFGVHNYKRWCHIVPDLTNEQTGVVINPLYYSGDAAKASEREKQLTTFKVSTKKGRNICVTYTVVDGPDLKAIILIE